MKISIGNDHRGYKLKLQLVEYLHELGHEVIDKGFDSEQSSDHPVVAFEVGESVVSGESDRGIVICGSGIGVSVSVNKVKGVCCAVPVSELQAKWSRQHNDSNVIAFAADFMGTELVKSILKTWLEAEPDDTDRYVRRRKMVKDYEEK